MPAQAPSFIAAGDIGPSRFVTQTTADHTIVQSVANDAAIGVSHEGTRHAPITGITPLAAKAGESVQVYTDTWPCEVIAAATITAGQPLKPDLNGAAVVATAGQVFSAIARAGAASGERCKVTITRGVV